MNQSADTIAAFATAIGGPVAVIRISGPSAVAVSARVWRGGRPLGEPPYRELRLGAVAEEDGSLDREVLAVYMPGPRSYTGEDVVELHCHGGILGARLILLRLLRAGCRHAEPGEFTRRAFLNGRMDLTQAEAVADLIEAHSEAALHLANRQLAGHLGRTVGDLRGEFADLAAECEARLDFPEEELDWISSEELDARLTAAAAGLEGLLASRHEGEILRHGVRLVLAGPPNVGKSSLLNAILGRDRAIVTDIPGTTRDTLEELARIRGIPVQIIDTAGIREAGDEIEKNGIERSYDSLRSAQVVLWLFDASRPAGEQAWRRDIREDFRGVVVPVGNKIDLAKTAPREAPPPGWPPPVYVSALRGQGLDELYDAIEKAVWDSPHAFESEVAVNARHAALLSAALADARAALAPARAGAWELASTALRSAVAHLGRIVGETVEPDLLDVIFSRFCIGK